MKLYSALISFSLVALTAASCGNKAQSQQGTDKDTLAPKDSQAVEKPTVNVAMNDAAQFIAGMNPAENFQLEEDQKILANFRIRSEADYKKLKAEKLDKIREWIVQEKIAPGKEKLTLFYPFAGADFIYANSFFPDAANYILIGLEPAGYLPNFSQMTAAQKENYLFNIYNSLGVSNEHGFFRTNSMAVDFKQKVVNGTLHAILYYMAHSGHQIVDIQNFELDTTSGKPNYIDPKGGKSPYGVEITFTDSTAQTRKVYYMSYNIWDPELEKSMELFKFLDSFGDFNVFMKAASYLCAYPGYKIIREYMLNNAQVFVQDDSGMPYKYLNTADWDLKLYGNFTRVIGLFHNYNQPDLAKAYKELETKRDLPFFIGYNTAIGESNLQYAVRKAK